MRLRKWLEPWGDAQADSYVVVDANRNEISLKIADCTRTITLEFAPNKWNKRTKARALKKVDTLEMALAEIRDAIVEWKNNDD